MAASAVATAASSMMSNAHYFEAASNPKMDEIKKLLDSRDNKEKLEGMKRLIAVRLCYYVLGGRHVLICSLAARIERS